MTARAEREGGRDGRALTLSRISHTFSPYEMSKKSFRNNLSARLWTHSEGYLDNGTEWQEKLFFLSQIEEISVATAS